MTRARSKTVVASRLRLKQLGLVAALGELGNLHRAADALNVSQPTATRMLRDVESAFGFPLFERLARGMAPTELGAEVVNYGVRVLADLERLMLELESKRAGGFGHLVVGAIMGAAPDVLARAVADLKSHRPLLNLTILGETSDSVLQLLESR